MGLKSVCVHGHFYQPPREDPLSGLIPNEQGAQPYQNWNERILFECYKPNAILRNFEKISFNIGPTLFNWIKNNDPETYQSIVNQENLNYKQFGIGNAIAQAYHHVIMPLANKQDKITQIKWGIADFIHHFGHKPQGMWLPETAVDLETLSCLADNEIKFTILAPWQVEGFENLSLDQPYLVELPDNRDPIVVFLYNRELSTLVSFNSDATKNADHFIERWVAPLFSSPNGNLDKMTLIASDGELYGHHKIFRDKFLAHMLNGGLHQRNFEITYPGLWLADHKPQKYVKIIDATSWSCHHGVARWMDNCDCTPGAVWKSALRSALDRLSEAIDDVYKEWVSQITPQAWELRNQYIQVILKETELNHLVYDLTGKHFSLSQIKTLGILLAAQYERQRMFASCGWFFDHFHRIEPQNNVAYASQAVWLTKHATGIDLKPLALELLHHVRDDRTGLRGDTVFAERYQRTEDFIADKNCYFNASSSFST